MQGEAITSNSEPFWFENQNIYFQSSSPEDQGKFSWDQFGITIYINKSPWEEEYVPEEEEETVEVLNNGLK